MNLGDLPASPAWVRTWAASHTHAVSYTLDGMREGVASAPTEARALRLKYPQDSILRCTCGSPACRGAVIVCGIAIADNEALLLVREGPQGDPRLRRDVHLELLHLGGGLTPRLFETLLCAPLGAC